LTILLLDEIMVFVAIGKRNHVLVFSRRQNVVLCNACDRGFPVQVTLIFTVL